MDSKLTVLAGSESKRVLKLWKDATSAKTGWFTATDLANAVQFFINAVDDAIKLAEQQLAGMPGKDKKEFVLAVIANIYDTIIGNALPGWLYLVKGVIKDIVINVIVSKAIDFIVSKYNEGLWK